MKLDGHKFMPFGIHVGKSGYFLSSFEEEEDYKPKTGLNIDVMFTYTRDKIPIIYPKHVVFCHIETEEPRELEIPRTKHVEVYRVVPHDYPIGEIEQWSPLTYNHFYAYVPLNHDPLWLAALCAFSDNEGVKGDRQVVLQLDPTINLDRFKTLFNFKYLRIIQSLHNHLHVDIDWIEICKEQEINDS